MPSPLETRAALKLITGAAVGSSLEFLGRVKGSTDARRRALLDGVPDIIGYYSDGSSALAADFYEESRELAGGSKRFAPRLVVQDRVVKTRSAIAWASQPFMDAADEAAAELALAVTAGRLAEIVQIESARPFRDTILVNSRADAESVGWRRVTAGGCKFCRMLADRGAIYSEGSARFAAHEKCNCAAEPVFVGNDTGERASVIQYVASRRNRTPKQRAELRAYLDSFY